MCLWFLLIGKSHGTLHLKSVGKTGFYAFLKRMCLTTFEQPLTCRSKRLLRCNSTLQLNDGCAGALQKQKEEQPKQEQASQNGKSQMPPDFNYEADR